MIPKRPYNIPSPITPTNKNIEMKEKMLKKFPHCQKHASQSIFSEFIVSSKHIDCYCVGTHDCGIVVMVLGQLG